MGTITTHPPIETHGDYQSKMRTALERDLAKEKLYIITCTETIALAEEMQIWGTKKQWERNLSKTMDNIEGIENQLKHI